MDNNRYYRNQTSTLTQIQAMSRMRITTTQEAVAFLRAIPQLQEQVAYVLQRSALREQNARNAQIQPTPTPTQTPTVETVQPEPIEETFKGTFVPEDLSSDEGYSESEVEEKVAKLKASKKKASK